MSFEIRLPFEQSKLPTTSQWNAAIRAAGFDLVLDDVEWATPGFLPARLLGNASGFELWCDPADDEAAEVAPGVDCVVSARLGSNWFELVCAMCSLAALQSGTRWPLFDDDGQQQGPAAAMADAERLYNQARIIVEHLRRPGELLAWTEPPLGHAETEQTRRADLESLVSDRTLIRETSPLGERFRLHKLRRQELAEQVQMNTPGTAS